MPIVTSLLSRRLFAVIAILAWTAALAMMVTIVSHHAAHPLFPVLLFTSAVAITATLAWLICSALTPIEAAFNLGMAAGFTEGHRQARPVVVPAIRLEQQRESHRGQTAG